MSSNGDNGPLSNASFNLPTHMAYDPSGYLYITDFSNNEIRQINMSTMTIAPLIGNGTASSTGNNGSASTATTFAPYGIAMDLSKNIFFSEYSTGNIRKIDTTGKVTLVKTTGSTYNYGLAFDISQNLLIGASGSIYKIAVDPSGVVSTRSTLSSFVHGVGQAYGVSVDTNGNIWLAGKTGGMQKCSLTGTSVLLYSTSGTAPLKTNFSTLSPSYVYPLANGNIVVISYTGYILNITPGTDTQYGMLVGSSTTSKATLIAGSTSATGNTLGNLFYPTQLSNPTFLSYDGTNAYITEDTANNILKITNFTSVTNQLGSGTFASPATLTFTNITSGCIFNLDATQNITYNGSNVITSWTDTVNGIPVTVTGSPTYTANVFNGRPGVLMAAANAANYVTMNTQMSTNTTGMTMFLVMYSTNFIPNGMWGNFFFASNLTWASTGYFLYGPLVTMNATYQMGITNTTTNSTPIIFTFIGGSNYYSYRYNGVSQNIISNNGNPFYYYLNSLNIGYNNTGNVGGINGNICQSTCFNRVLTPTEVVNMEAYLSYKWQIPLGSPATISSNPILTLSSPTNVVTSIPNPATTYTITGKLTSASLPAGALYNFDANYDLSYNPASSNLITSWKNTIDSSGVTVGGSPTYVASAINGYPGINFPNGTYLKSPVFPSTTFANGMTVFAVVNSTNYVANTNSVFFAPENALNTMTSINSYYNILLSSLTTNKTAILVMSLNGASQTTYRVNGMNSYFTLNNSISNANFTQFDIGNIYNSTGYYFGGQIGQIMVFNQALSLANIQSIESYLSYKWQISIGYSPSKIYTSNTLSVINSYSGLFGPFVIPSTQTVGIPYTFTPPTCNIIGTIVYTINQSSSVAQVFGTTIVMKSAANNVTVTATITSILYGAITTTATFNINPALVLGSSISNPFTLASVAGGVVNYDSKSTPALTGSNVTGWTDSFAGKGVTMTGTTSPTYVPAAINGNPGIYFAQGSMLTTATLASSNYTNMTFVCVVYTPTNSGNQNILASHQGWTTSSISLQSSQIWAFGASQHQYAQPFTNTPYILTVVFTPTGYTTRINGVASTGNTYGESISYNLNQMDIGNWQQNTGAYGLIGYIGEIAFYNNAVSIANLVSIENYLSSKWQIAVGSSPFIYNTPVGASYNSFTIPTYTYSAPNVTFQITDPTSTPASTGAITYSIDNTSVATVSGNTVTIVKPGTAYIKATIAPDNNGHGQASSTALLTINGATPSINALAVNNPVLFQNNATIVPTYPTLVNSQFIGTSFTLIDPSSNSPGAFTYTSSNTAIVTVGGGAGKTLTMAGVGGFVTIRATQAASTYYAAGYVDFSMCVIAYPTIVFSIPQKVVTTQFTINNTNITSNSQGILRYTSTDSGVTTIDTTGVTNTVNTLGTASIHVAQDASGFYLVGAADASFVVLRITPTNRFIIPDQSFGTPLTIDGYDISTNSTGALTYTSNNTNVATISNTNLVTFTNNYNMATANPNPAANPTNLFANSGVYSPYIPITITALQPISNNYDAKTTVSNTFNIWLQPVTITKNANFGNFIYNATTPYTITSATNDATKDFTSTSYGSFKYSTTNTTNISVTTNGQLSFLGAGTNVPITVMQTASGNFYTPSTIYYLNIAKATPTVSLSIPTQYYGNTLTLDPSTNSTGSFSYTVDNAAVGSVSVSGVLTFNGLGTANVTLSQNTDANYNAYTATVPFTVNKGTPIITNFAIPQYQTIGLPYTIQNPLSTSTGSFSYTSSDSTKVTASGTSGNTLLFNASGSVVITGAQTSTTNYNATTFTANVTVNPFATLGAFTIPVSQTLGIPYPFTPPTTNSSVAFSYTVSPSNVASISGTTITFNAIGTAITITATQALTTSYGQTSVTSNAFNVYQPPTVGVPFVLSNITGGVCNYDASSNVSYNSTTKVITGWTDSFNPSNTIASVIGSPIYYSSGINSKPAIYFPQTAMITTTSLSSVFIPNVTISCVFYCDNYSATGQQDILGSGGADWTFGTIFLRTDFIYIYGSGNQHFNWVNGTAYIMTVVLTPTTYAYRFNGVTVFSGSSSNTSYNINSISIANQTRDGNNAGLIGYFGQMLIYNSALSSTDVNYLESYLSKKWQIPIGSTPAIAAAPYTFTIPNYQYGVTSSFTITPPSSQSSGTFAYTSSKSAVATVSGNTVTIVSPGITTITATQASDNANYGVSSATAQLMITTTATLGTFTINSGNPLVYGPTYTITNPTSNNSGGLFTYTSSDTNYITISGNTITVVNIGGPVTITATQAAYSYFLATTATVNVTVNQGTPSYGSFTINNQPSNATPFTFTPPTSTSPVAITYSSSNTGVATVSGTTITVVGGGTTTITASQVANSNYLAGSTTTTFIVVPIFNPTVRGYISGWGYNNGQLGMNNNIGNNVPYPTNTSIYGSLTGRQVAMVQYNNFGIALDISGQVHTWGPNDKYQLGNNSTTSSYVPINISIIGFGTLYTLYQQAGYVVQIAAGYKTGYALDNYGRIHSWGYNNVGQLGYNGTGDYPYSYIINNGNISSSTTFIKSISCGYSTPGAIDSSGNLYLWGWNNLGQVGIASIATTSINTPTIINSSTTNPINTSDLSGVKVAQFSSYYGTSIAIDLSGNVYTWGQNTNALGLNAITYKNYVPIKISANFGGVKAAMVSCGGNGGQGNDFCLMCDINGNLWTWGYNGNGQLGLNSTTATKIPQQLSFANIKFVAAGLNGSSVLDINGNLWSCGYNSNKQIGNNVTYTSNNNTNFTQVNGYGSLGNCGVICSYVSPYNVSQFVVTTAGTAINPFNYFSININTMVNNQYTIIPPTNSKGAITYSSDTPSVATVTGNVITVLQKGSFSLSASIPASFSAYGNYTSGSISTTVNVQKLSIGYLNAWGYNGGNIGNGTNLGNNYSAPVSMNSYGSLAGRQVTMVQSANNNNATSNFCIALDASGQVHTWGSNNTYGQLGNGGTTVSYLPVNISANGSLVNKTIKQISIGYYCCFALDTSGNIHSWGYNATGQLGNGTTTNLYTPQIINSYGDLVGKTIAYISNGRLTSGAIDIYGNLYTWGNNGSGQLGNNSTTGQVTSTTTGGYSTVPLLSNYGSFIGIPIQQFASFYNVSIALDINGQVHTWGTNSNYGLGNGNSGNTQIPMNISNSYISNKISSISCGADTSTSNDFCVVCDVNNYAWTWGSNTYGQLGINNITSQQTPYPLGFSNLIVSVAAGENGSIIIDYYGNIYTCGRNDSSQIGNSNVAVNTNTTTFTSINSYGILNNTGLVASSTSLYNTTQFMITVAGTAVNPIPSFYVPIHNMINQQYTIIPPTRSRGSITYSIDTPSVATVSGNVIKVLQKGSFIITASIAASYSAYGNYNSQTITSAVTVKKVISAGYLSAWGQNNGYIGDGTSNTANYLVPTNMSIYGSLSGKLITMVQSQANGSYTIALDTSGQVHTWGNNNVGQLGTGNTSSYNSPVNISNNGSLYGKTIVNIAAGDTSCFAVDSSGNLHSWGYNNVGQLGNGTTTNTSTPQMTSSYGDLVGKTIVYVGNNKGTVGAIDSFGNLYTWGNNSNGQLGNNTTSGQLLSGTTTYSTIPLLCSVGSIIGRPIQQFASFWQISIALDVYGNVHTWGTNTIGALGNGTLTTSSYIPINISGNGSINGQTITMISCGSGGTDHCVVCDTNGNAHSWGVNNFYQLMLNNNTNQSTPQNINQINSFTNFFLFVGAGSATGTNLIDSSGNLYTAGWNATGQLGNNTTVAAGSQTLANSFAKNINSFGNLYNRGIMAGYISNYGSPQFLITNQDTPVNSLSLFGITTKYLTFPTVTIPGPLNIGDSTITYASLNTSIATIGVKTGVLSTIAIGSCTVTASVNAYYSYYGNFQSQTISSSFQVYKDPSSLYKPGYMVAWGYNYDNVLGNNTPYGVTQTLPKNNSLYGSLAGKKILMISFNTCAIALDASGRVHTWGGAYWGGQLGNGQDTTPSVVPQDISNYGSLANVFNSGGYIVMVKNANGTCFAVDSFGQLHSWGSYGNRTLGNNLVASTVNFNTPVNISTSDNRSAIYGKKIVYIGGNNIVMGAIDINGNLYTWGTQTYLAVGNGGANNGFFDDGGNLVYYMSLPILTSNYGSIVNRPIVKFDSDRNTMALDIFGHLHMWGNWSASFSSTNGPYANSYPNDLCSPPSMNTISSFYNVFQNGGYITDIAIGDWNYLACDSNGQVHSWGASTNKYNVGWGSLGFPYSLTSDQVNPVNLSIVDGFTPFIIKVSAGIIESGAKLIDSSGNFYVYGNNAYGEIGNGTIDSTGTYSQSVITPINIISYIQAATPGTIVVFTSECYRSKFVITYPTTPVAPTYTSFIVPNQYITFKPYTMVPPISNSNGPFTYTITSGSSYVSLTNNNNVWTLTPIAVGQVTILATQAAYYDYLGNFTSGTISTTIQILPAYTKTIGRAGDIYAWGQYAGGNIPSASVSNGLAQGSAIGVTKIKFTSTNTKITTIVGSRNGNNNNQTVNYAIDTSKNVWFIGDNYYGADGTATSGDIFGGGAGYSYPFAMTGLSNIIDISPQNQFNVGLALDVSGYVWAWGNNRYGGLGNLGGYNSSNTSNSLFSPTKISGLSNIRSIASDEYCCLASDNSGNVFFWGMNSHGCLGDGQSTQNYYGVTQITALNCIIQVSVYQAALALDTAGRVWFWGNNQFALDGNAVSNGARLTPIIVSNLSNIQYIALQYYHATALDYNGNVWVWGYSGFETIQSFAPSTYFIPTQISNISTLSRIAYGGYSSNIGLGTNGYVYYWGYGNGINGSGSNTNSYATGTIPSLSNVASVSSCLSRVVYYAIM